MRGAFSLTSGLVAVERVDADGTLVILKLLRPGTLFPCADLFADGSHGTGAWAVTEATACFVPIERLRTAMSNPAVAATILHGSCAEARHNESIIFQLCSTDLSDRILALLEQLAENAGPAADGTRSLTLPLAWRDISAMIGTSPEVLSRTLRRLVEQGRLTFSGRRVTLTPGLTARRA